MQETKGHCKHGEFDLREGCPDCIQEQRERQELEAEGETTLLETAAAETAVALRPGEDLEAHGYFEEAKKLLDYAEARVIATAEDVKAANDDLSLISKLKKVMENKRKSLLNPLKFQADAIRETYDYLMAPIRQADGLTREKMLAYNAEQERIRLEQEDINRKRQEAAEQEMRLKGEITESVDLVEVAPEASKKVSTEVGTTGQRIIRKWELVDMSQVPEEYKILDSARITKVVKAGIPSIAGIRIYEEPILTVRAK